MTILYVYAKSKYPKISNMNVKHISIQETALCLAHNVWMKITSKCSKKWHKNFEYQSTMHYKHVNTMNTKCSFWLTDGRAAGEAG